MTSIYTLRETHGPVRYVGKTSQYLIVRLDKHIRESRFPKCHRHHWIQSVLSKGGEIEIELIEIVEGNGSAEEIKWIKRYRNAGADLVNATNGGEGTSGITPSEIHRQRLSSALTGIKRSDATKAKIRAARALQAPSHTTPHSQETKDKIKATLADPERRERMAAANRGKKRPPEHSMKRIATFKANKAAIIERAIAAFNSMP